MSYFILIIAFRWLNVWTLSVYFTETNSRKRLIILQSHKDGIHESFLTFWITPPPLIWNITRFKTEQDAR